MTAAPVAGTPSDTGRRNVLDAAGQAAATAAHQARVDGWLTPRRRRRSQGISHPVDDFLWDYYRVRPARLRAWHPGFGVVVPNRPPGPGYREVGDGWTAVPDPAAPSWPAVVRARRVVAATAARPVRPGCLGMHEWAMVLDLGQDQLRHSSVPLRVTGAQVADVIGEVGLRCTHFDAYRFFTPAARSRQRPLTRAGQVADEQPACLHAGMDLYRYAAEALPFVGSDLVADCFAHARLARELDMAASPYDLRAWGVAPVLLETAAGRHEYTVRQVGLAERAARLRARLLDVLERIVPNPA